MPDTEIARCRVMRSKRAFTAVELIVVIAIIGILIALLFPAIQMARESARRTTCKSNLSQIAIALQNYEATHLVYPPGSNWWKSGECGFSETYEGWSWSTFILPEMDQDPLFSAINFDSPSGAADPDQSTVAVTTVPSYVCPSDLNGGTRAANSPHSPVADYSVSNVAGVADSSSARCPRRDGMLYTISSVRSGDIQDGASQTLLIGEVTGENQYAWIAGNIISTGAGINQSGFSSHHTGGCHFGFVDGHVTFLSELIDSAVLTGLTTRDGTEVIDSKY